MNSDIRISVSLLTNTKIRRLIRRKGYEGFYNIVSLWIYAGVHRPNGVFNDMDEEDLMDAAETKDAKFIELLIELNLLVCENGIYKIHDWNQHNHWASGAEIRSEKARKAAEIRWHGESSEAHKNRK